MAENFQKAIEDLTQEEAQAEVRRAWEEWRHMDDLYDQARAWAIAANSLRVAALERIEKLEQSLGREQAYVADLETALACDTCSHPLNHAEHLLRARAAALEALEEAQGKIEAVREWKKTLRFGGIPFQDLDRILSKEGNDAD